MYVKEQFQVAVPLALKCTSQHDGLNHTRTSGLVFPEGLPPSPPQLVSGL